jgi:hypothetical protein
MRDLHWSKRLAIKIAMKFSYKLAYFIIPIEASDAIFQ